MIDRQALLKDLQRLLPKLEADLRERCGEVAEVGSAVRAEYDAAKEAERTAQAFEAWRADYITQIAAAWVLSCVFARFLEDNELVNPPRIAGPGERLRRARDEYELHFRNHPTDTDREYLLSIFDALAKLPGGRDIFGEHNAVNQQRDWLSGDAAKELLGFFQRIEPESGELIHDFTDPEWDTRFLGDLYQDLSEAARKKYALLQTPEFVEEFILDRTLDPAIEEFGLNGFRMIDPACGSGHFLLGSFQRLFDGWCKAEPGTNVRELVQRAFDSVHGVDINPFAVAIARFRLLLVAMRSCQVERLADAPGFTINLVCGDSLLHGSPGGDQQLMAFHDVAHVYQSEDLSELRRILTPGTYHAVVANPPYITPKDRALNQAYRQRFSTCHMKYSLAVPFMQRIFDLAVRAGDEGKGAGYTGQITANSFMKREFGKKLIEEFFKTIDLTHVIDTSGAYLPGHGTPTVILYGKNRKPVGATIRTAMGKAGEPSTPEYASSGKVWVAILSQIDVPGSESEYMSVLDSERETFSTHPWSIGGGGAAQLKEWLDDNAERVLDDMVDSIGPASFAGVDDAFVAPLGSLRRFNVNPAYCRPFAGGDQLRDWISQTEEECITPYDENSEPIPLNPESGWCRRLWYLRSVLQNVTSFGSKTRQQLGEDWWTWYRWIAERVQANPRIVFAFVATHNHFIVDRARIAFNRSAPIIMMPTKVTANDYSGVAGLLNSSVGCFWMKQVFFPKGGDHVGQEGARVRRTWWDERYEFAGTGLLSFPLPGEAPIETGRLLESTSRKLETPESFLCSWNSKATQSSASTTSLRELLSGTKTSSVLILGEMTYLQEDLDWQCYQLYGLINEDLTYEAKSFPIKLGERAFEIVLARKMAGGEVQTTWFERHGSTPITELPADWPDDYRRIVERRIEVIESNSQIALIEQPEYKRRWNTEPWKSQVEKALQRWLLDRLESHFDRDGRMNDEGEPTAQIDIDLISVARLADVAARDDDFMEVAELYRGRQDFDVATLVAELVQVESVPLLPMLRYKPAGMDKRQAWERTWDLQRQEDAIDARTQLSEDDPNYLTKDQAKAEKQRQVGDIPVPPKYTSSDFISTGGAKYWKLRGKLDVPKERWVSFPHCEAEDQTLVVAWAGYDHLQLARAIAAYFAKMQEEIGGSDDPRLVPLLGCILELIPWLKQWHNDIDPEFDMRMGDYFESFVEDEARTLGLTAEDIRNWKPPQRNNRRGRRTSRS